MPDNINITRRTKEELRFPERIQDQQAAMPIAQMSRIAYERKFLISHSETYHAAYILIKRGFDIVFSLLMCVLLLPVYALITALIKLSDPGPAVFKHRRVGQFGEEFDCLKFRTMVNHADEMLENNPRMLREFDEKFKIEDDPRLIRGGKFLRASSLDELPQFINVLRGEMTLIGPRPVVKRELAKYAVYQGKLLSVKPGLSGLWQVSGRSETTYEERIELDLTYIDQRSLWMDTRIFFRTIATVLQGIGAK